MAETAVASDGSIQQQGVCAALCELFGGVFLEMVGLECKTYDDLRLDAGARCSLIAR